MGHVHSLRRDVPARRGAVLLDLLRGSFRILTVSIGYIAPYLLTTGQTCSKTLEEIEVMFSPEGPRPWHTKKGHSRLDVMIDQVREKQLNISDVVHGKGDEVLNMEKA